MVNARILATVLPLIGIIEYFFGSARQILRFFFGKCIFLKMPPINTMLPLWWQDGVGIPKWWVEPIKRGSGRQHDLFWWGRVIHVSVGTEGGSMPLFRSQPCGCEKCCNAGFPWQVVTVSVRHGIDSRFNPKNLGKIRDIITSSQILYPVEILSQLPKRPPYPNTYYYGGQNRPAGAFSRLSLYLIHYWIE